MNFNTYGYIYSNFRKCSLSKIQDDIIVFDLGNSPFETWAVSRMYPSESIVVDSNKPFLLALKSFFKSDVTASVICNSNYLWTVILGNERMIFNTSKEVLPENTLHFYATPYFVRDPRVVSRFLEGTIKPAYENVYFYKNTILYLDNQDAPYPGGHYFDKCEPSDFYRICFLSDESIDYVCNLAAEWKNRPDVSKIPFMSKSAVAYPKFLDIQPVREMGFSESNVLSTGIIERKLSPSKPEHVIQDILISYYQNLSRHTRDREELSKKRLGLMVEWPMEIIFENSKSVERINNDRKFIALSINGNVPDRTLHVAHPYDRYVEYNDVPATIWTPVYFVYSTLITDPLIKKVILDTVVVGLVYKETFFCFSQVLLEGRPTKNKLVNAHYVTSVASTEVIESDPNIHILESFRYNDNFSLRRVVLKGVTLECWCLTRAETTHPRPKNFRLTHLVKEWLNFFTDVGPNTFDVDVSLVRLALTLSKHNICYNLVTAKEPTNPVSLTDNQIKFYASEKVVQFINDARIVKMDKNETNNSCTIS